MAKIVTGSGCTWDGRDPFHTPPPKPKRFWHDFMGKELCALSGPLKECREGKEELHGEVEAE